MKQKRMATLLILIVIITVVLAGCMRQSRSETFIIPDSEEELISGDENELFGVKTIYRLLDKSGEDVNVLGWIDRKTILGLFGEQSRAPSFERIDYPYETRLKLSKADKLAGFATLSPDGRYLSTLTEEKGKDAYSLKLVSMSDQQETDIAMITYEQIRSLRAAWASNSRFLAYTLRNDTNGEVSICVYDIARGQTKEYSIRDWQEKDIITAVHIADDGQSAVIVKRSFDQYYVVFGGMKGSEFTSQYEHAISPDGWVEWIHEDQIAFAGPEGTLYGYDRRNAALSVLLEQIDAFRLSPDRKYIAYTQGADTVYAAVMYGNNILNKKSLYRGIVPSQLVWSPDNGKLLLSGSKPYAREVPLQSGPAVVAPMGNQSLIIEFE
ncbi:hypothetical protein [Cohnella sp. WQ 127256]|uniref:hypothetical protein n=1 Tax=Cohnella sp. WQ 127256 TaxID=2938790 RepID=UPI0021178044|nr:hypothetical protein [Cohnella sp. WQ 127256]